MYSYKVKRYLIQSSWWMKLLKVNWLGGMYSCRVEKFLVQFYETEIAYVIWIYTLWYCIVEGYTI